jgi:hypothetical protein
MLPTRERGLRRPEGRASRPVKPGRSKISQIATATAAPAAEPPAPAAAAAPGALSPRLVTVGRKESWCCDAACLRAVCFCPDEATDGAAASCRVAVAAATAAGVSSWGRGEVGGEPAPADPAPASPVDGSSSGSSSGRLGGSGHTISGGADSRICGATGATGALGVATLSDGSGAETAGGITAGGAGVIVGAPPPICVGICDPISVIGCVADAHEPPMFQVQIHPGIPVSIG